MSLCQPVIWSMAAILRDSTVVVVVVVVAAAVVRTRPRAIPLAMISNGNRTEWSPIRSVIIQVITKSDDRAAGVRFVYHEYD